MQWCILLRGCWALVLRCSPPQHDAVRVQNEDRLIVERLFLEQELLVRGALGGYRYYHTGEWV